MSAVPAGNLCPEGAPVVDLRAAQAFAKLPAREQAYAARLALAAWAGFPVLLSQVSREAPAIHEFLSAFLSRWPRGELQEALQGEASSPRALTLRRLLEYAGQFYEDGGNYSGFGDTKVIPRCSAQELRGLISEWEDSHQGPAPEEAGPSLLSLLDACLDGIYSLEPSRKRRLGFGPQGTTAYYSPDDLSRDEVEALNSLCLERGLKLENTHLVRNDSKSRYEVSLASVEVDTEGTPLGTVRNLPVVLTRGRCSKELARCCAWLCRAQEFATEAQREMLSALVSHYTTGDCAEHVRYSELWVQDVDPLVETYQGFIETYREPSGVRAEYEGFVACVDVEESRALKRLVSSASKILPLMPYPPQYERATFQPPSYNALTVLTFCCSGFPIGINIPNYEEVRGTLGFKNVSLTNVMSSRLAVDSMAIFLAPQAAEAVRKHLPVLDSLHTALHELYGHGSGKLFTEADLASGAIPDALEPGKAISSCYPQGKSFYDLFGGLQNAFEECRAETTALYLGLKPEVQEIFGVSAEDSVSFGLAGCADMLVAGLRSLPYYDAEVREWGQAHCQARFAILRACLMWGRGAVRLEKRPLGAEARYCIEIDPGRLGDVLSATGKLLVHLNYYKACGLAQPGAEFFRALTSLDAEWMEVREEAIRKKRPRAVHCGATFMSSPDGLMDSAGQSFSVSPGEEKPTSLDVALAACANTALASNL